MPESELGKNRDTFSSDLHPHIFMKSDFAVRDNLVAIKTNHRSRLDAANDLRLAITNISPCTEEITNTIQAYSSHLTDFFIAFKIIKYVIRNIN